MNRQMNFSLECSVHGREAAKESKEQRRAIKKKKY